MVAQKLEMDLADARILCSHLLQYKNEESPFSQPYTELDHPIKWWSALELNPPHLQNLAIHLFSICPNSASCERGFSICGWFSNKRRLKLSVKRLESMVKLISYYRSNASQELAFYGKGTKRDSKKLSDEELNNIVNEALAEPDDEEDDEIVPEERVVQRTTDGHIIPTHAVIIWIENTLDLSDKNIIKGVDGLEDFPEEEDENDNENRNGDKNRNNLNEIAGRGVMDFNVEDLTNEFL